MIVTSQTASSQLRETYRNGSNRYAKGSPLPTSWVPEETLFKLEKRN